MPSTGLSSAIGSGRRDGQIALQPARQHAACPGCGARLSRNLEAPANEWAVQQSAEEVLRGKLDPAVGVAALVIREVTAPGQDGLTWRVLLTDGDRFEQIDVEASGSAASSSPATSLGNTAIERALEQRALGKDRERDRLAQLIADAPIALRADELHE